MAMDHHQDREQSWDSFSTSGTANLFRDAVSRLLADLRAWQPRLPPRLAAVFAALNQSLNADPPAGSAAPADLPCLPLSLKLIAQNPALQELLADYFSSLQVHLHPNAAAAEFARAVTALQLICSNRPALLQALDHFICQSIVCLSDRDNIAAGLALALQAAGVEPELLPLQPAERRAAETCLQRLCRFLQENASDNLSSAAADDLCNIQAEETADPDTVPAGTEEADAVITARIKSIISRAAVTARRNRLLPQQQQPDDNAPADRDGPDDPPLQITPEAAQPQPPQTPEPAETADPAMTLSQMSARAARGMQQFREDRRRQIEEGLLPDPASPPQIFEVNPAQPEPAAPAAAAGQSGSGGYFILETLISPGREKEKEHELDLQDQQQLTRESIDKLKAQLQTQAELDQEIDKTKTALAQTRQKIIQLQEEVDLLHEEARQVARTRLQRQQASDPQPPQDETAPAEPAPVPPQPEIPVQEEPLPPVEEAANNPPEEPEPPTVAAADSASGTAQENLQPAVTEEIKAESLETKPQPQAESPAEFDTQPAADNPPEEPEPSTAAAADSASGTAQENLQPAETEEIKAESPEIKPQTQTEPPAESDTQPAAHNPPEEPEPFTVVAADSDSDTAQENLQPDGAEEMKAESPETKPETQTEPPVTAPQSESSTIAALPRTEEDPPPPAPAAPEPPSAVTPEEATQPQEIKIRPLRPQPELSPQADSGRTRRPGLLQQISEFLGLKSRGSSHSLSPADAGSGTRAKIRLAVAVPHDPEESSALPPFIYQLQQILTQPDLSGRIRNEGRVFLYRLLKEAQDEHGLKCYFAALKELNYSAAAGPAGAQWSFMLLCLHFMHMLRLSEHFFSLCLPAHQDLVLDIRELLHTASPLFFKDAELSLDPRLLSRLGSQEPQMLLQALQNTLPLLPAYPEGQPGTLVLQSAGHHADRKEGMEKLQLMLLQDIRDLGAVQLKVEVRRMQLRLNVVTGSLEALQQIQQLLPQLQKLSIRLGFFLETGSVRLGRILMPPPPRRQ